jgi:hypothetical protein
MMTSASTFPLRLTKIDDLTRPDHFYLTAADDCYFLGEYTARKGFAFSATNRLILNFKKTMDRQGKPEWPWKERALREAAAAFRTALNNDYLNVATLVPVPPSKAKTDPLHGSITANEPCDFRIESHPDRLWSRNVVGCRIARPEAPEAPHLKFDDFHGSPPSVSHVWSR